MKLKLQNIGIIEEADITIDGITLIAGQNDSGKSTVGKVLYALIRGINREEEIFNYTRYNFLSKRLVDFRFFLSRIKTDNKKETEILGVILTKI